MARPSARLAVLLAAAVALPAALLPLVPEWLRPFNFAAFGAVAVFAAARGGRLGLPAGLGLVFTAKLVCDLLTYRQHGYDADYLPIPTVYAALGLYALAGWAVSKRSGWWTLPAGVSGSVLFFLATNAAAWWQMALPYDRSLAGLLDAYWMGLPFYRGTFASDVLFTGGLTAGHALLARATAPAAEPARG